MTKILLRTLYFSEHSKEIDGRLFGISVRNINFLKALFISTFLVEIAFIDEFCKQKQKF
jgi:hypothetical protein